MTTYQTVSELPKFGDYSTLGIGSPGEVVVVAGQMGTDGDGAFPATFVDQVKQTFDNLGTALAGAGLGFGDVLGFRYFIVGRDLIPEFMQTRKKVFAEIYPEGEYPAATLLLVSGLVDEQALVEIEALAVRPEVLS